MDFTDAKDYKQYLDMCNSEAYQQLQKFYHRQTLFDITGIARQENPHSSFIKWLLNPCGSHGMNDFPMKRFLETICFAYIKYGHIYLDEKNTTYKNYSYEKKKDAEKILLFSPKSEENGKKMKIRKNLMQGNYIIDSCKISREKVLKKQRRADIYIDMTLRIDEVDNDLKSCHLLLFIENKVNSSENEEQTDAYMEYLLNDEKAKYDYIIPLFLYPVTNNDLINAVQSANDDNKNVFPCVNRLFLLLNYQYLLDGVISPCQTAYNDNPVYEILSDYVACLGKSIEDNIEQSDPTTGKTTNIVMAASREEKEWSIQLWNQHQKILVDACNEFSKPMDERFLLQNDSDEQFYRTVLSSVKNYLEEQEKNGEQTGIKEYLDKISDALKSRKATFYVKQRGGEEWKFASGGRKNKTLGALGYVIICQYIADNPDYSSTELIKDLKSITHPWLRGVIVSKKELQTLMEQWLRYYKNDITSGCPCYKDGIIGNGQCAGCQMNKSSYTRENGITCTCFFDLMDGFFVGGLDEKIRKLSTDSMALLETMVHKKGINETFDAIQIGNSDDFIYVARYWAESTLEQLIAVLKMGDYVGDDLSKVQKSLSFTIEEVTNKGSVNKDNVNLGKSLFIVPDKE